jgi:glycosyltransferase involved in cell wall biosynthesis
VSWRNQHQASPRIAIVHDYLTQKGGAERVVLSLCRALPEAPVYAALYDPEGTFPDFRAQDVRRLWLDRFSFLRRRHRLGLPLLPLAFASSRVDADVVVCSSSGWSHGIRTNARKIVYCHSPAKWLYRPADYLGARSSPLARVGLRLLDPALRRFDRWAATTADIYLANSTFIADEIERVYGIDAEVVWPPAGLEAAGRQQPLPGVAPGFLLTVARLLPYKNVEQVIEAFRGLVGDERLVVVGDGPERDRLRVAAPPNVRVAGEVDDATLRWLYANAAGLVLASREDFGLIPVEAAAFGKPVAALRWGGFVDTVSHIGGVFFDDADPYAIARSVRELLSRDWDADAIRARASAFSEDRFAQRMREVVRGAFGAVHEPAL